MKKMIALLLAVLMLASMTACGGKENKETEPAKEETPVIQTEAPVEETEAAPTEAADISEWGVACTHGNSNEIANGGYEIRFPKLVGIPKVSGLVGYQEDGTRVIVDGELWGISPDVNDVEEVFPTYFEQTVAILDTYYDPSYADFAFTVDSQEVVEVNDYTMCKYNGTHTFTIDGQAMRYQFVAYAVLLHANEGVTYWMVLDESEDQSLIETIESHAYNMALSLIEY